MKKKSTLVIFSVLGLIGLAVLAFMISFSFELSGNPLERFRQQREILQFYESRYDEDFKVIRSSYDYKRNEFSFRIASKNHPELFFTSTLDEAETIDKYAAARCIDYLHQIMSEALGDDFADLQHRINIHEKYEPSSKLERDLETRLNQNHYVVDISWDTPTLDPLQVDALFADMTQRISQRLDKPVGGLRIRAGVYDGKNYYHTDTDLR